jgi:hypothetical protein
MDIVTVDNFSRSEITELFNKRGYKRGVEVGVCTGRFSETICRHNPQAEVFGVDDYDVIELRTARDRTKDEQEQLYQEALNRLSKYNYKLIRKTSVEASLDFANDSIDFVYIDGGHTFEDVMLDVILWGRKVRKGGIISGHDYYNFANGGIIPAVNAYCAQHGVKTLNLTSVPKDKVPSFWFEKTW